MNGFNDTVDGFSLDGIQNLQQDANRMYLGEEQPYTIIPNLYGFGTDTRAAYGSTGINPKILAVNSLEAGESGEFVNGATEDEVWGRGTFAWCLRQEFPRVVVFEVSGLILVPEKIEIGYLTDMDYMTIAGQTAPDRVIMHDIGGVNNGGGLQFMGRDFLIQHISYRGDGTHVGSSTTPPFNFVNYGKDTHGVVVDHCSVAWNGKGAFTTWINGAESDGAYQVYDVTISNSIGCEGIRDHATGYLTLTTGTDVQKCLFSNQNNRHPFVKVGSKTGWYNNVIHNITYAQGQYSGDYDYFGNPPAQIDFVNNVHTNGLDGATSMSLMKFDADTSDNSIEMYMANNEKFGTIITRDDILDDTGGAVTYTQMPSIINPIHSSFNLLQLNEVEAYVLANAGDRPAFRDTIDQRLVDEVTNRVGSANVFPADLGTGDYILPSYATTTATFVPVANPHDIADGETVYTNLEKQLHALAESVE